MKTRNLILVWLLVVLVSCQTLKKGNKSGNSSFTSHSTIVDNKERTYWVFKPSLSESGNDEEADIPVLFMFHGSRSNGKALAEGTEFNNIAERENLMVVYPDALVSNWAEGCGCNNADRLNVKDIEFVETIIDEVRESYSVDTSNVFAAGFSQGGLFVDRLACELSNKLQGAIVVAATMSVPLSQNCTPKTEIPMMFIQGTNDTTLPYEGVKNGALSLLSAKETTKFWAEKNGIDSQPTTKYLPDSANQKVEIVRYSADQNTSPEVILYSVKGFGHGWPTLDYFDTNEKIAEFISKHQK